MQLIDFLQPENVRVKVKAQSKKRALEMASEIAATYLGNAKLTFPILDALLNREKLGSTGIGQGVGLPHCRLDNIDKPIAILISIDAGVDYQGLDKMPVDIILALLVPIEKNELYLQLLAWIAEQFSKNQVLERVRSAQSAQTLYNIVAELSND